MLRQDHLCLRIFERDEMRWFASPFQALAGTSFWLAAEWGAARWRVPPPDPAVGRLQPWQRYLHTFQEAACELASDSALSFCWSEKRCLGFFVFLPLLLPNPRRCGGEQYMVLAAWAGRCCRRVPRPRSRCSDAAD